MMFKTFVGPVEDDAAMAYLRPETAQGIFVNFANVQQSMRKKLPFGIAQIGKSFRNEITPGNFIFRDREFEQMEMEFFVKPGTDEEWHRHWMDARMNWWSSLGVRSENLRLHEIDKSSLAHYAKADSDVEYLFPMGWGELEGIANRTDYDLKRHGESSLKDLTYFDEETNEHIVPFVIEPSLGVDRTFLVFLLDAYREEQVRNEKRVVLGLNKHLAPIKVAVLPLLRNRPEIVALARQITATLRPHMRTDVRRHGVDRPPLSPPGRDRHALLRHRRCAIARRQRRDHPRPRHAWSRCALPSLTLKDYLVSSKLKQA